MEGDAGPQVAVYDRFEGPFHQYQFMPGRGCEGVFGAKQGALSGRFSFDSPIQKRSELDPSTEIKSNCWEGFSFMAHHNSEHVKSHDNCRAGKISATDLCLDYTENHSTAPNDLRLAEPKRKQSLPNSSSPPQQIGSLNVEDTTDEDAGNLSLKLCPGTYSYAEDSMRNNKRYRSSSPGGQSPMCQVDDCKMDLKQAKDYHRRHKVCEMHSKAPQSLVHGVMQRFCQQCSRFHPLEEFDEGKRSCRRRLAGHNKRRRKPHPELALAGVPLPDAVRGSDLISIFAILSQLQASRAKEKLDVSSKEQDVNFQGFKRPNSYPSIPGSAPLTSVLQSSVGPGLQRSDQEVHRQQSLSPEALILMVRNVLGAQVSAEQEKVQRSQVPQLPTHNDQSIHQMSNIEEMGRTSTVPVDVLNLQRQMPFSAPYKSTGLNGGELSSHPPSKMTTNSYLGTTTCNGGMTNTASAPDHNEIRYLAEQKLFPTESGNGLWNGRNGAVHISESRLLVDNDARQDSRTAQVSDQPSRPPSDSSESGSDQSPASSSSDGQVQNGRICFKLFDPNRPPDFPYDLRLQVQRWLSCAPSHMEHYLRPGCILLTIFIRVSTRVWEELVTNLRGSLRRLLRQSPCAVWLKGRILVQVEDQRAFIFNGKVKTVKPLGLRNAPVLKSVRPLAIVAGQKTTLVVSGQNLTPETKVVCVYQGRYVLHEVPVDDSSSTQIDDNSRSLDYVKCKRNMLEFGFPGGPADVFGRCFVEVEHDLFGNFLPVIVADSAVCAELRTLESELDSISSWKSSDSDESSSDEPALDKDVEAQWFLHELGWIFQSSSNLSSAPPIDSSNPPHFYLSRFKKVLRFAVLHDWCAVVKKLLDLLFSMSMREGKEFSTLEAMHVLSEVNLVHQAVKRKCRSMVELLLHYTPDQGSTRELIFTPVSKGPVGMTPLHVAASISDAEDIVDALTNDPGEVGLLAWRNILDFSGQTPEWHAMNSGNLSYIAMVEKKLSTKQFRSVNITIMEVPQNSVSNEVELSSMSRRRALQRPTMCRDCGAHPRLRTHRPSGLMYRPMLMTIVAIATVCASVALYFKGPPRLDSIFYSLKWDGIDYGPF